MAGVVETTSLVKMEFAMTSIPFEHFPLHSSFEKLGDTQCRRVLNKEQIIYICVGSGVQFKFQRVENGEYDQFPLYRACTSTAQDYFHNSYVLIRNISPKLIAFGEEALEADPATGAVNLKCYGSLSAELMCIVQVTIRNTVGQLKTLISAKLVQLELASSNMPIMFTDAKISEWHNGAKIATAFGIVVPKVVKKCKIVKAKKLKNNNLVGKKDTVVKKSKK